MKRTPIRSSRKPMKRGKPLRQRGRKYANKRARDFGEKADWVRTLPCLVCQRTPCDPHHEPPRSLGGTSRALLPLCRSHHSTRHHTGLSAFERITGLDLLAAARRLEKEWAG